MFFLHVVVFNQYVKSALEEVPELFYSHRRNARETEVVRLCGDTRELSDFRGRILEI